MTTSPEKVQTRRWDAAEHLSTTADTATCLEAEFEDGAPSLVAAALSDIARAKQSLANPVSGYFTKSEGERALRTPPFTNRWRAGET